MKKTLKINLEVLKVLSNSELNSIKGGGSGHEQTCSGKLNNTGSVG